MRIPHWAWFLVATVALVIGFTCLSVWLPWYREQEVISMLNDFGPVVKSETAGPDWLRDLVGDGRMAQFGVFDRAISVNLDTVQLDGFRGGSDITTAEVAQLTRLTNLRFLHLRHRPVTDAGLADLSRLTNLRGLDVTGRGITDATLAQLRTCTKLETLHLMDTVITDSGLAHVGNLPNLRDLSIYDAAAVTDAGLRELSGLTSITDLTLRGTQITDAGLEHLRGMTKL